MFLIVLTAIYMYGGELKPNLDQTVEQLCFRIDQLCTEERLNDHAYGMLKDVENRQLRLDIAFSKERRRRNVIEEAIISKVELIKMPTETNTTVAVSWIKDRESWVRAFRLLLSPYEGDGENFWRLCRLASKIKPIDCPMDLAHRTRFVQTPENLKRREHQKRIQELNIAIKQYRGAIVDACENYVTRMSEEMSDKEFTVFSNQVEKVVQPDKIVRGRLFYEAEFKKRLRSESKKSELKD